MSDDTQAQRQLDEIRSLALDNGKVDVLVNNAGLTHRGTCINSSVVVQKQVMEVNHFGQIAVTKALYNCIPDDGAIVTIGSLQSKLAVPYRSAYSASKHAIQVE